MLEKRIVDTADKEDDEKKPECNSAVRVTTLVSATRCNYLAERIFSPSIGPCAPVHFYRLRNSLPRDKSST